MATPELVVTPEGILTAKEPWAVAKGVEPISEKWLNEIRAPHKEERERKEIRDYIRKVRELGEENERREAEIAAVREHARRIGEITLQLQREAEERKQERAKAEQAAVEIEQKFRRLADQWRKETMLLSSSTDKLSHPAYLKIIGMGMPAVPLILKEMEQNGGHWFLALRSITEEDPVNPDDAGRIKKMAEAWLEWGRQHRYL